MSGSVASPYSQKRTSGPIGSGKIIETGSNSNGEYTKWEDGTLICKNDISSNSGADVTWTFPHAFASGGTRAGGTSGKPCCVGACHDSATRIVGPAVSSGANFLSTTSYKFVAWIMVDGGHPSRTSSGQMITATGYWK